MYQVRPWHKIMALLVTVAFLAGLAPLAPSAQALDLGLGGAFGTLIKVMGIGYIVQQFGGAIDDAINNLLGQRGLAIEGKTKVVPILRIGVGGASGAIGAAQVMGPAQQVNHVRAVGQLDWIPGGGAVRGRILLPVTTDRDLTESVRGVEGVGISAVIAFPL